MLKAIFFDLDHTLADTAGADAAAFAAAGALAVATRGELAAEALLAAYQARLHRIPFDPEGEVPVDLWRTRLWQEALQELGAEDAALAAQLHQCFTAARLAQIAFFPGVVELLAALRSRFTLVIITNGDSDIQWPKLAALGAADHVDHIIVSGDAGCWKPDAGIFEAALALAGCLAGEAIHVGDSLRCDIGGGINAGLAATVWIDPDGTPEPPEPMPRFRLSAAVELPGVLDQLEERN